MHRLEVVYIATDLVHKLSTKRCYSHSKLSASSLNCYTSIKNDVISNALARRKKKLSSKNGFTISPNMAYSLVNMEISIGK